MMIIYLIKDHHREKLDELVWLKMVENEKKTLFVAICTSFMKLRTYIILVYHAKL